MAFTVKIKGDASHLQGALAKSQKGISSLAGGAAKFAAKLGAVGLAMAGVASAGQALQTVGNFLKDASSKASGVESLTMQFETLLGSVDAAVKRMDDVRKFAASTPFEVAELAKTSKLLQTLGGEVLSTGDGLRMVGDAASISGERIEEVGLHIGRIFNAITSGTSVGESVSRMQELGLMTGKIKIRFEELAAQQKKGTARILDEAEALKLLQNVFKSTDGAMAKLSATTEGKMSNMKDSMDALKVSFGEGLNVGIKAFAENASKLMASMKGTLSKAGLILGDAIRDAVSGNYEGLVDAGIIIGEVVAAGVKLGLKTALVGSGGAVLSGIDSSENWLRDALGIRGLVGSSNLAGNMGGKKEYLESSVQDAVDAISAAYRAKYEPVGVTPTAQKLYDEGFRGTSPGYQGTEMGKMLDVLQRIERKTAPIKF